MNNFSNRWMALSQRERIMIGVMVVLLGATIGWFGIWRPLDGALRDARSAYGLALDRASAVDAKLADLKASPNGSSAPNGAVDLSQAVSSSASEAGFTLSRATPQGSDRLAVTIDSARSGPLLAWLTALEGQGIAVETISVAPAPANEVVAVQMTLRRVAQ